jgi:hypothetical protein
MSRIRLTQRLLAVSATAPPTAVSARPTRRALWPLSMPLHNPFAMLAVRARSFRWRHKVANLAEAPALHRLSVRALHRVSANIVLASDRYQSKAKETTR